MRFGNNKAASKLLQPVNSPGPVINNRLPPGIYNNFVFEFFNAVMFQCFGTPVILFIRQSGASAFLVGSLSAFPLLLMPVVLITSQFVEKAGYRRVALVCWFLRWAFCSLLIWVALLDFPGFDAWRVPLVLLIIFLFHLTRNLGGSANFPWLTAIIPPGLRGLYLSRTQLFANMASVGTFLVIGLLLGNDPTLAQFAPVFVIGALGGLMSSIFMVRIQPPPPQAVQPNPTPQAPRRTFWAGFRRCFARPGFVSFVVIQSFYGLAFISIPSLSLIYLREKVGISPSLIVYFATGGVAGATIAALFWGRWIDRRGVNSLQLIAFIGLCFNSVLWVMIGLFGANELNIALAALVSVLSAVWISALNMSQTHAIMALAPVEDRVLFQNVAVLMTYSTQALAPMLWGIMLDILDHKGFSVKLIGLNIEAYRLFFLASLILGLIGAAFLMQRIKFHPETGEVAE
jgi:MFS family permease